MLFNSLEFALFLPITLLVYHGVIPRRFWRARKGFLVVASYLFYMSWNPFFGLLLLGSTLIDFTMGLLLERTSSLAARRMLLLVSLAFNLGMLGYFKYGSFVATNVYELLGRADPPPWDILLPVGISFYTFESLAYTINVYRGERASRSLLDFSLFLSFFPHLVAGPIVRPSELIPQIEKPRNPRRVDTSRAFYLIATGLFKKVVIANYLASSIVDQVFAAPGQHSSLEILIAVYAYAVQIYADFSGYTDIAIGIALLLGFSFPQNFDSPYAAVSVQDFWRRWHMTLSRWLRDYVYIPLGGNRKGTVLTYRNLMLTMLIGGLWHGAAWTFVVWGGLHGVALAGERWWHGRRAAPARPLAGWPRWRARILTFHFVCFAWIFFRSDSFGSAWDMIEGLFTGWGEPSPLVTSGVLLAIAVGIGSQYLPARLPRVVMARFSRLPVLAQATVLALALMVTSVLGPEGVAPFIYFQF